MTYDGMEFQKLEFMPQITFFFRDSSQNGIYGACNNGNSAKQFMIEHTHGLGPFSTIVLFLMGPKVDCSGKRLMVCMVLPSQVGLFT
jgi:hypothetical protein